MPVIRCGVPLLDLRGRRIGPPDLLDGCRDSGFDVDLHRCGSSRKLVAGTGSVRRVHSPVLNSCLSQAEPLNSRQIHYEGSRDPRRNLPLDCHTMLCRSGPRGCGRWPWGIMRIGRRHTAMQQHARTRWRHSQKAGGENKAQRSRRAELTGSRRGTLSRIEYGKLKRNHA